MSTNRRRTINCQRTLSPRNSPLKFQISNFRFDIPGRFRPRSSLNRRLAPAAFGCWIGPSFSKAQSNTQTRPRPPLLAGITSTLLAKSFVELLDGRIETGGKVTPLASTLYPKALFVLASCHRWRLAFSGAPAPCRQFTILEHLKTKCKQNFSKIVAQCSFRNVAAFRCPF